MTINHTPFIPWSIVTHETLPSTQDKIKEMITSGNAKEGLLIHALKQTNGHGRHGRKWEEGSGNLYFSFLLQPDIKLAQSVTLSLVTGIALTRTIKDILKIKNNDDIILKWPNDIMLNKGKCAGILVENASVPASDIHTNRQNIIIGIGVNITTSPMDGAISLSEYKKNTTVTAENFLNHFTRHFEDIYKLWLEKGFHAFRAEFIDLTYEKNTPMRVKLPQNTIEGSFQDVDEWGNLLILCKDSQKLQKITVGDVFLV
ncbi:MAG: biotin--[acetyl-CoA-carboxylase] ligase [Alphaproteobacteria bacterium]|nr:biotin--[acetyl-CoA-carboxylase] ligase [Alphaproteobacteria bacterium]